MSRVYGWHAQVKVGERGTVAVAEYLRRNGCTFEDVTDDPDYRTQDIDFRVKRGRQRRWRTVEVKTDLHTTGNFFFESRTNKGLPGCVFKSRAQVWMYWFPLLGKMYIIELPALQLWLVENAARYASAPVTSVRGNRRWGVDGWKVPIVDLVDAGIAGEVVLEESEECIQAIGCSPEASVAA